MIVFIDMAITVSFPSLSWVYPQYQTVIGPDGFIWNVDQNCKTQVHLVEVKPAIRSLGEVIRQIRMYQAHCSGKYYVCCPDDRFKSALASQGIGFIRPEM